MFIKFDVFGKRMSVLRQDEQWLLFADSGMGMRTRVYNVVIPPNMKQDELVIYLDEIFHEHSSENHPHVRLIS